jgi:biopolymer transport protein ExbD
MAGSTQNDDAGITGINVTPLVDVMLVLLIIFMVTANLINNKTIGVALPKAATGIGPEATAAKVEIGKDGAVTLDGRAITLDALAKEIAALKGDKTGFTVSIAADRAASHGRVIDAIDAIRQGGVYDFAFAVTTE